MDSRPTTESAVAPAKRLLVMATCAPGRRTLYVWTSKLMSALHPFSSRGNESPIAMEIRRCRTWSKAGTKRQESTSRTELKALESQAMMAADFASTVRRNSIRGGMQKYCTGLTQLAVNWSRLSQASIT